MPGMIKKRKKTGLDVDSSIMDAAKKVKDNKRKKQNMLDQISGSTTNDLDSINERLNYGSEPESVRKIFES